MGERIDAYMVSVRKREGKRPLVNLDIDGSSILKWIFKTSDGSTD